MVACKWYQMRGPRFVPLEKHMTAKRSLARTGISVHPIGLGAMPLSIAGRPEEAQALAVIDAFVAGGGNFIDTANVYCLDNSDIGHNERLIHKALRRHAHSDGVIVATKGGLTRPRGRWEVDARPEWLRISCEQSLTALGVDAIGLYQLHAVDPQVDLAESLGELVRLQSEGKILHIGVSNVSPRELDHACRSATIVSVQNRCNVFMKRDVKNGLIEICRARGISYIPYGPVGGHNGHLRLSKNALLQRLARKYGASVYCIALAWLLAKGEHVLPIPGASKVASVQDSLMAATVDLSIEDVAPIDAMADG